MVESGFQLVAVHVTADLQPFGGAGSNEPDAATISATYVLADPGEAPGFAATVEGYADAGIVSTTEEVLTTRTSSGYALSLIVPPVGLLVKGGEFSVSVALPPTVLLADGTALLPQLLTYTTMPVPQIFDGIALPTVGGRTTVVWHGYQDPTLDLEYWYRKVRAR